jgi:hypothetical protein
MTAPQPHPWLSVRFPSDWLHDPQSGATGMQSQLSVFGGRQLAGRGLHVKSATTPSAKSQYSCPVTQNRFSVGPHANVAGAEHATLGATSTPACAARHAVA